MARKVFDTTCDLVFGPGTVNAGLRYASGPCRFVYESIQLPDLQPLKNRVGYVELGFALPNEAAVMAAGEVFTTDYNQADIIAIPRGSLKFYEILFIESVNWRSRPPYYRCHVSLYTPPIPCSFCAGAPFKWVMTLANDYANAGCLDCAALNGALFTLVNQGDCLWVSSVFAGPCATPSQWYLQRNGIGNWNLYLQAVSAGLFLVFDPIPSALFHCHAANTFINPAWEGTPACSSASAITILPV